jgi:hypothetical protein
MALFEQPSRGSRSTFTARYNGYCGDCGGEIDPGDEVMYDSTDSIVHADCEVDAPPRSRMPMVCSKCFIAHAGECF